LAGAMAGLKDLKSHGIDDTMDNFARAHDP
jgi:hypothetical protein